MLVDPVLGSYFVNTCFWPPYDYATSTRNTVRNRKRMMWPSRRIVELSLFPVPSTVYGNRDNRQGEGLPVDRFS